MKYVYILEKCVTDLRPFPRNNNSNGVFTFFKACPSYEVGKRIAYEELAKLHENDNADVFGDPKPKIYGCGMNQYDMWWCEDSFGKVEFRGHEVEIGE